MEMEEQNLKWLFVIPVIMVLAILIYYVYRNRVILLQRFNTSSIMPSWTEQILVSINSRSAHQIPKRPPPPRPQPIPRRAKANNETFNDDPKGGESTHLVKIKDFEKYVKKAAFSGALKEQFGMIPKGQTKPWDCGKLPENKLKNRYGKVLPYDETRVVLEKLPHDPYSDYINASYIKGYNNEKEYIATQGPKSHTIMDFWRMIWQENVHIICMLANVIEGGKRKCEQYWPEIGCKKSFDGVVVHNVKHEVFVDYTFRTLQVSRGQQTRKITHLHYTAWPDHEVPMYSHSVVMYLKKLLALSHIGPIVVHCSAGIGRTGTIILCDICLRRAAAEGVIDVFTETRKIRSQRVNMVGNNQQYLQAHLAIAECLLALQTTIICKDDLPAKIHQMKEQSSIQLRRLHDCEWQDRILHHAVPDNTLQLRNRDVDRYSDIAYDGIESVTLQRYRTFKESNKHISVANVDGLKMTKQYIATKHISPSLLSEFWRLIERRMVELIVILQLCDPDNTTNCDIVTGRTFEPTSSLEVTTLSESDAKNFTTHRLLLSNKSHSPTRTQPVTILRYKGWIPGCEEGLPQPENLVELWQASERIARSGPTLAMCQDGTTGSGLYLALSFLLERMSVERECDIYFAIRAVRRARSKFVETQEQIDFLYDAAVKYAETFATYANFQ